MAGTYEKRIRSILLKRGLLSEDKAEEAASQSKSESKPYDSVLVERGMVDEATLISTIASEMNIPPIDVERIQPEDKALQSLSQELATYYGVLPVARIGNILTLAVANPFDILKLDDLRLVTECEIRPVISTEHAIRKALSKAYNPEEEEMENLLKEGVDNPDLELAKADVDEDIDLAQLADDKGGSPVIKIVNMIIHQALKDGASDIHIEPFEKKVRVRFRRDGVLQETFSPPKKMHGALISRIKIMAELDIAERRIPQDGKFQMKYESRNVDFRISILPTIHGEKAVMRVLDSGSLSLGLENLGFEPSVLDAFRRAIGSAYGMILVTGPTGSGKSTTLYSSLKEMLCPEDNIVTVEDPVEYQLEGVIQVPVNAKKGLTFAAALRSILRQDPDTVMIGEIRDHETADIAVKAAITGHLVLSTLHTNDSASTITRLIDMGIDPFMVSSSLLLVSAQRLLRKLCAECKQQMEVQPPVERLAEIGFLPAEVKESRLCRPVGCQRCANGYRGRFAVLEALEVDDGLRKMVISGASAYDIKNYGIHQKNMITLRRCGILNATRGKTSIEEVLRMTMHDESVPEEDKK
jgi:type IV pilus assembly protein PilB